MPTLRKDFEVKQIESDDPEVLRYRIKLPAHLVNDPEFLKFFEKNLIKALADKFFKLPLDGTNG